MKSKNKKDVKVDLIKKEDFVELLSEKTGIDIAGVADGILIEIVSKLVQLDARYPDVYQMKNIETLL